MEPAVRFHHIYEVDGDPDRFDVTFQTYTQQHAYQMKLLTSIAYGSTTINIDYQDGSDSEHYNYAKAINIRDNGTLIRKSIWSNIKEFCTITDRGTCLLVLLTKLHFLVAMALHPRLINVDIHLQAPALEEQTIGAT